MSDSKHSLEYVYSKYDRNAARKAIKQSRKIARKNKSAKQAFFTK